MDEYKIIAYVEGYKSLVQKMAYLQMPCRAR